MSALKTDNWNLVSKSDLDEYNASALQYRNRKNGLEVLHVKNSYPEIFGSYLFYTPPHDNRGIPHIIEHLVFCGSEKFLVKDPFIELSKGSINSFYNAMTYPDKTAYPFASAHEKDFFNVLNVYTDAVFSPLMRREAFLQEGVRIYKSVEGKITAGGVVYNEMLGSYAAHETLISEYSGRLVFSDTHAGFDSGGEPEALLGLDYDKCIEYYKKYYQPYNCRFFLFGDIETEKILEYLDSIPAGSFKEPVNIEKYSRQKNWQAPRRHYIAGPADGGSSVSVSWTSGNPQDTEELMQMEFISEILLGNQDAPLYKLLTGSGMGQDLSAACGLECDGPEMVFTVALRGLNESFSLDEYENMVFAKIKDIAENGVSKNYIISTFEKYAFRKKENRGGYPLGFKLMNRIIRTAFNSSDPFNSLKTGKILDKIRHNISSDSNFIQTILKKMIKAEKHYSTVLVYPHSRYQASPEYLESIIDKKYKNDPQARDLENKFFAAYLEEADNKQAADKIPSLDIDDISANINNTIINEQQGYTGKIGNNEVFFLEEESSEIIYIDFAFPCTHLDRELIKLLPLYGRLMCTSPTKTRTREKLLEDIDLLSGGIYAFTETSRIIGNEQTAEKFYIRLPVMPAKIAEALSLLEDIILNSIISADRNFMQILNEQKNDILSSVMPNGNIFAALASASVIDPVMKQEEMWRGIEQYLFLETVQPQAAEIRMKQIKETLFRSDLVKIQVCSKEKYIPECSCRLGELLSRLKDKGSAVYRDCGFAETTEKWKAYELDSGTGYIARSFRCPAIDQQGYAEHLFIAWYLANKLLWEEIRINSGAYGANASVNGAEGVFTFTTFRDPDVKHSFQVIDTIFEKMAKRFPDSREIEKNIISLVGNEIKPMLPEEKSIIMFRRRLYGIDTEIRTGKINNLLELNSKKIKAVLDSLCDNTGKDAGQAVFAGIKQMKQLQKELSSFPNKWPKIKVL